MNTEYRDEDRGGKGEPFGRTFRVGLHGCLKFDCRSCPGRYAPDFELPGWGDRDHGAPRMSTLARVEKFRNSYSGHDPAIIL